MSSAAQLLVYRFDSEAGFEGRLTSALERIEAGGALRVLDVLFVGSDPATGEIFAIDLHRSSAGGMVSPLLGFRLDVEERRRTTRRALADGPAELIGALGQTLEPGDALAALLVRHEWAHTLEDAVARTGGKELTNRFVDSSLIAEIAPELLGAAGSARAG
jgi:hypothetical protein